jgi:hypothetical protein
MQRHRFLDRVLPQQLPLSRTRSVPINPSAFCVYPLAPARGVNGEPSPWQQWIYQIAFEQAQAVVQPSLPERDLLGSWN